MIHSKKLTRRPAARSKTMIETLSMAAPHQEKDSVETGDVAFKSNMTAEQYEAVVEKAKEYITAGDIIQVVLSQRFQTDCRSNPIDLYRALRFVNPSPYLFFLKLDDLNSDRFFTGSYGAPGGTNDGTAADCGDKKKRKNRAGRPALSDELLSDEKERAEHVMLVDLGRNDLGRVARNRQRSG